ncbi:MAG TPA: UDP-N-acetylglucosamine--N-acetylmuramyl-(pentapeptide) pyrophosphoryl-undecaprenol N-acetylglucosamine transferase [Acidimicrobiales bacterium]
MAGPIVITGGGTGGHIFPMEAVADQLRARGIDIRDLRFVGSRRGQESSLLAAGDVALTLLPGRGFRRSIGLNALVQNLGAAASLGAAVVIALSKVRQWRPSVVVSLGGYASFATSVAAVVWRRPLVLVELDAEPGAAQRLFTRYARARCCAFPTNDAKAVVTGTPLRESIVSVHRDAASITSARENSDPPIEPGRTVVVVMTGSLGSTKVNAAVSELAQRWSNRRDRTIIHVTGRRDVAQVRRAAPMTDGLDYRILEFGDMVQLWSICDLAICRAGASTVAELTTLAIPSVLVPLPHAPGDHQMKNALVVVEAGGARLVLDAECSGAKLDEVVASIAAPRTLASMGAAAATLGRRDAAQRIAGVVADVGGWS